MVALLRLGDWSDVVTQRRKLRKTSVFLVFPTGSIWGDRREGAVWRTGMNRALEMFLMEVSE